MNYTLHQLQVFLKITQTQSITKAAEELHLTQPAVSIQLKNFQDQFDIPLTEVVGRKLFVTDFGKEIAVAAEKILHEVHEINYKTLAYKGQLTGRLVISVVSTGKYVMPYFLPDFLQNNPGVDLKLDVTNKTKVVENLEKNEVDFSLVSVLPETLQIEKVPLMPNKLFLVAPSRVQFKQDDLFTRLPLIYREKGSGTRHVMESYLSQQQINVPKKLELTSNEAVKQAVLAGLGCSIMPLIGIGRELQQGDLQIIPQEGLPLQSTWHLVWAKGKNLSPAAKAFLQYIQTDKDRIIKERFYWTEKYT